MISTAVQRIVRATDSAVARGYLAVRRERNALLPFLFHSLFRDESEIGRNVIDPLERTTVEQFRRLVVYYLEHGYRFVGPDEVLAGLDPAGRYAMLTFDDGYFNNTLALPVLEELKVPALFFISTNHVRENKCFWWDVVYRECVARGQKPRDVYFEALAMKGTRTEQIEANLIERYGPDALRPRGEIDRPFSPDELRAFAAHPYVHLGNHTANHAILTNYTEDEVRQQLSLAQAYLTEITGQAPVSIAYPNGGHDERIVELTRQAGIRLGFTVRPNKTLLPIAGGSEGMLRIGRFVPHAEASMESQCRTYRSDLLVYGTFRDLYLRLARKESTDAADAPASEAGEGMRVEVVTGDAARVLLNEACFAAAWSSLAAACPWATSFQGVAFARAWYGSYATEYEPSFVLARDAGGALTGLLALGTSLKRRGSVVVCGGHQAEYQAWVCAAGLGEWFPPAAFAATRRAFPRAALEFEYLPPGLPLGWTRTSPLRRRLVLRAHPRPLMTVDAADVAKSLKKSANKSKLKALQRLGDVRFDRVEDPVEFARLFDELVAFHDFRQIALRDSAPFVNDPHKRPFHEAMIASPGLLHVTALRVGERLASLHVNAVSGRDVHLCLIAHDPRLGGYSPGKLHVLMLARLLAETGFDRLDLTPGGEGYKERFANGHDEVHTLCVYPNRSRRRVGAARRGVRRWAKGRLSRVGVTGMNAQAALSKLKSRGVLGSVGWLAGGARRWLRHDEEVRVFVCERGVTFTTAGDAGPVSRDALDDLLAYRAPRGGPGRQEVLSDALDRMERGQHFYGAGGEGRPVMAWLAESPDEEFVGRVLPGFVMPPKSALVSAPSALPWGDAGAAVGLVARVVAEALRSSDVERVYVAVTGDRVELADALGVAGFVHAATVRRRVRGGRSESRVESLVLPPISADEVPTKGPPPAVKARMTTEA